MRVNSALIGFFRNRLVVGSGIAIMMLVIFFIATSFTKHSDRDMRAKQVNLIIRQIGHKLLLQSGDLTSRVLPVNEIREGTFLLEFEKDLAFDHDSLMSLSQNLLPKTMFPSGYTVTVHECIKENIVYGFQINNTSPDILACQGRRQPRGCYSIEIAFPYLYEATFEYPLISLVYSGMLVLIVTLLVGRFRENLPRMSVQNQAQPFIKESASEFTPLGKFLFDVKNQRLLFENEVIGLTGKECKILELLTKNFGELISRETLMQEVWINEGVITGRSLDVFASKLRKKINRDPELRITNVHGKGYKLE